MFRGRGGTGAGADGWETLEARQALSSNIMQSHGYFLYFIAFLFGGIYFYLNNLFVSFFQDSLKYQLKALFPEISMTY